MQIKVKRAFSDVRVPEYSSPGAAGFNIEAYLPYPLFISPGGYATIPTGLFLEVSEGYELQVRPRAGHGAHGILTMLGSVDADFRDELRVTVYNHTSRPFVVESGMRLAQGVLAKALRAEILDVESTGR